MVLADGMDCTGRKRSLPQPTSWAALPATRDDVNSPPDFETAFNIALEASGILLGQRDGRRRRTFSFLRLRDRYHKHDWEGSRFVEQERYEEALSQYELALELKLRHLVSITSYDTIKTCLLEVATSINNVAFVQQKNGNRFALADIAKAYECSLYIKRFFYGSESHLAVGASWNNIGSVHYADQNYKKALYCFRKARKILREFFAIEHLDICIVTCNIGDVYYRLQNWRNAVLEYRSCLRLRWILLGPYDKQVTELMQRLATVEMNLTLERKDDLEESDNASCYGDDIDDNSFAAEVNGLHVEIQEDIKFFEGALTTAHGEVARDHLAVFLDLQLLRKIGSSTDDSTGMVSKSSSTMPILTRDYIDENDELFSRSRDEVVLESGAEAQCTAVVSDDEELLLIDRDVMNDGSISDSSSCLVEESEDERLDCERQNEAFGPPKSLLDGIDDLAACLAEFDTLLDDLDSESEQKTLTPLLLDTPSREKALLHSEPRLVKPSSSEATSTDSTFTYTPGSAQEVPADNEVFGDETHVELTHDKATLCQATACEVDQRHIVLSSELSSHDFSDGESEQETLTPLLLDPPSREEALLHSEPRLVNLTSSEATSTDSTCVYTPGSAQEVPADNKEFGDETHVELTPDKAALNQATAYKVDQRHTMLSSELSSHGFSDGDHASDNLDSCSTQNGDVRSASNVGPAQQLSLSETVDKGDISSQVDKGDICSQKDGKRDRQAKTNCIDEDDAKKRFNGSTQNAHPLETEESTLSNEVAADFEDAVSTRAILQAVPCLDNCQTSGREEDTMTKLADTPFQRNLSKLDDVVDVFCDPEAFGVTGNFSVQSQLSGRLEMDRSAQSAQDSTKSHGKVIAEEMKCGSNDLSTIDEPSVLLSEPAQSMRPSMKQEDESNNFVVLDKSGHFDDSVNKESPQPADRPVNGLLGCSLPPTLSGPSTCADAAEKDKNSPVASNDSSMPCETNDESTMDGSYPGNLSNGADQRKQSSLTNPSFQGNIRIIPPGSGTVSYDKELLSPRFQQQRAVVDVATTTTTKNEIDPCNGAIESKSPMVSCGTKAEGGSFSNLTKSHQQEQQQQQQQQHYDAAGAETSASLLLPCCSSREVSSSTTPSAELYFAQAKLNLAMRWQKKQHERQRALLSPPRPLSPLPTTHVINGSGTVCLTSTQREDALQSVRSRLEELRRLRHNRRLEQQSA